jgi:hypothetical protein
MGNPRGTSPYESWDKADSMSKVTTLRMSSPYDNLHMPTCACVLLVVLKRLRPLAGISAKLPRKQASCDCI